jgi:hypothetical protein
VTTNGPDVINNSGDFTIEFWTYVPVARNDQNAHQFMSQGYPGSAFYIGYDGTGAIVVGDNWGFTDIPMPFGTWTHIALTFDNNTSLATLYINGTLATASDFSFLDFYPFRIGDALDNTESLTGEIDELKAWNTVRTPAQVTSDLFGIPSLGDFYPLCVALITKTLSCARSTYRTHSPRGITASLTAMAIPSGCPIRKSDKTSASPPSFDN